MKIIFLFGGDERKQNWAREKPVRQYLAIPKSGLKVERKEVGTWLKKLKPMRSGSVVVLPLQGGWPWLWGWGLSRTVHLKLPRP